MSRGFWVATGVVAIAAGAWWWWWQRENEMQDLIDKLTDALPGRIGQWARQIAEAARSTAPRDVGELRWGILLGAIMDRESQGGALLAPRGPGGAGDYGHGRGLMQIDDRYHPEFTAGEIWKDPQANVAFGAKILRDFYDRSGGDLRRAVAAYNAGPRVFAAENPDELTTGGDYSEDVLARADSFAETLGELPA